LSWITPEIRAQLIQYASTADTHDLPKPQFITPQDALYMLGDKATVEARIRTYHKADGAQDIGGPPDVLPYLIGDLTQASTENHTGVPGHYSLMDTSVIDIYGIIAQWPAFPAETRKWAGDMQYNFMSYAYGYGPNSLANRLMREWWEHNKEAVLSRQYDKATWLPPQNEKSQTQNPVQASTPPAETKASSSPTLTSQAHASTETSVPLRLYAIIVLTVGALAGLWYFLRAKK
jgi:hypothetical protein